jgi:ceramide glucosyltransferase
VLLVNDSDIAVEPPYLKQVVAGLADPRVGMVTCLYRASGDTAPARWEALGVATDFAPGVLVAPLVGIDGFALGSTMAFRREQLDAIGGFAAIRDYLADDYQLGMRIAGLGYRTMLAPVVVETHLGGDTWGDVWRHQLRWSRTIRVSRRAGYCGYLATQASFWAIVAACAAQWWPAGIALAARLATAWLVGGAVLGDRTVRLRLWLVPIRDLWGFAVWIAGLVGDSVQWRDQKLHLSPDGRIVSVTIAGSKAGDNDYLSETQGRD